MTLSTLDSHPCNFTLHLLISFTALIRAISPRLVFSLVSSLAIRAKYRIIAVICQTLLCILLKFNADSIADIVLREGTTLVSVWQVAIYVLLSAQKCRAVFE